MKGWLFTHVSDGWRWQEFNKNEALVRRSIAFASLLQCVTDARRNGYSFTAHPNLDRSCPVLPDSDSLVGC